MENGSCHFGMQSVVPNMIVKSVDQAMAFYRKAFGAEEVLRLTLPDGKVVHCEAKLGNSQVNLGESMEGWPEHPLLAQLFVQDSDAVFDRAVTAGAEIVSPIRDMFFGSREGRVRDIFGNTWTISTRKEVVPVEEMQRRLDEMMSSSGD